MSKNQIINNQASYEFVLRSPTQSPRACVKSVWQFDKVLRLVVCFILNQCVVILDSQVTARMT